MDEKGLRQWREVLLVVARKDGKSLLASAIANYTFRVDGGYGSTVYCLAPKLEQADIVYNNIWQMVTLDPEWLRAIEESASAVAEPSIAEALLKNACEGVTYYRLRPAIGERQFYVLRQLFFIELDRRVDE